MDSAGRINDLGKQYIGSQPPTTHGGAMQLKVPIALFSFSVIFNIILL